MRFGDGEVSPKNLLRIMGTTLAISFFAEVMFWALFRFTVPWYGVTVLLLLFMYASESDLNYQDRVAQRLWMDQVDERLAALERERTRS